METIPGTTAATGPSRVRTVLVMGVCGCGKSTFGRALAGELGADFVEADDFHSPANVAKMASGRPLTDADRDPWLRALRERLEAGWHDGRTQVLACSALKAAYRAVLGDGAPGWRVVWLHPPVAVLGARLRARAGHFMPATLLASQLETLEAPTEAFLVEAETPGREEWARVAQWVEERL